MCCQRNHVFIVWGMLLIISVGLFPQTGQAQEKGNPLDFGLDYAQFRSSGDMVYLEIYISVLRKGLKFVQWEQRFKAEFRVDAKIFQDDSLIANKLWQRVNYVSSLDEITWGQKLPTMTSFFLSEGNYRLKVEVTDIHSGNVKEKELDVQIQAFPSEELHLSDIQLAASIVADTTKTEFSKYNYQVQPHPEKLYGPALPILYSYSEIYNLKKTSEQDTSEYSVSYKILNGDGEVVREFPAKRKRKPGTSAVEVGGINIITLTSGTYFLQLEVQDHESGEKVFGQKKFYVYRGVDFPTAPTTPTRQAQDNVSLLRGIYSTMTEEQLDDEFAAAGYIATKEEKKIFKTLDLKGKREFLPQFWAKKDKSPETPQNEFRREYLKRVQIANANFTGFKKGWKTDMGRVLLIYGLPDEINRYPLTSENKAYQIWRFFSIQGGVEFVFVDKRGWGEMELVHSTARGELSDSNWTRWISSGP